MICAWPFTIRNPCTKMDPNLLLQKCKQQYCDKLKRVKTLWVLVCALNLGHSKIAYWSRQLTKSNILLFVLNLWPLEILAPRWTQIYFFRYQSQCTRLSESTSKMSNTWQKSAPWNNSTIFEGPAHDMQPCINLPIRVTIGTCGFWGSV